MSIDTEKHLARDKGLHSFGSTAAKGSDIDEAEILEDHTNERHVSSNDGAKPGIGEKNFVVNHHLSTLSVKNLYLSAALNGSLSRNIREHSCMTPPFSQYMMALTR